MCNVYGKVVTVKERKKKESEREATNNWERRIQRRPFICEFHSAQARH
jgi:hypothetical protein